MTTCAHCGGPYDVVDDNGVTDPAEGDRWELWQCADCGHEKTKVLRA